MKKSELKQYAGQLVRITYSAKGYKQVRVGIVGELWENHFTLIIDSLNLKIQYKYVENVEPLNLKK